MPTKVILAQPSNHYSIATGNFRLRQALQASHKMILPSHKIEQPLSGSFSIH